MLLWHLEMRSSDTLIVCQFLLVIACILRGIKRLQNMFHVGPCIRSLFAWHVPKYVLCNYFCDISGQFSHSDLSSVLLSVMLCMSRSLDRSALFPILLWKWKMLFRQWKDKENWREEFPRPSQVLKWPNAEVRSRQSSKAILMIL